jgi:predicted transcriptional regulator
MKLFKILFVFTFLLLVSPVSAQIQYYGIDAILDSYGRSSVELILTFPNPEQYFVINIAGKVENFNATSLAGPVNCNLVTKGITTIACNMNLTSEKRTIDLRFDTNDFVRTLDNKFYFDVDFSLNQDIDQVFASVRLPEGMGLVEGTKEKLPYPENVTIGSDGRRFLVDWRLPNINKTQPLRLQVLYEQLQNPIFRFWQYIVISIIAVGVLAFLTLRYTRRPEKLILSVLDEYERKIMDNIVLSGGVVNQKKVVQETNLSKAKVSRVVKSLMERGLIEIERVGRNNKLKLIKKKFRL